MPTERLARYQLQPLAGHSETLASSVQHVQTLRRLAWSGARLSVAQHYEYLDAVFCRLGLAYIVCWVRFTFGVAWLTVGHVWFTVTALAGTGLLFGMAWLTFPGLVLC